MLKHAQQECFRSHFADIKPSKFMQSSARALFYAKGALAQEGKIADTTLICWTLQAPRSVSKQKRVHSRRERGKEHGGSVSHGAGGSEIREELEAQADDKVPDVSGHLRTGDEDAPDQNYQDSVECVANVSQPRGENKHIFIKC